MLFPEMPLGAAPLMDMITLRGLKFVQLDLDSIHQVVFADASFTNNPDGSSQIGFVIILTDANKRANVIHWSSIKRKRVTRSILASELYAMSHGYDLGSVIIKATVGQILGRTIPLIVCTDSKSIYECMVKLGTTNEKKYRCDLGYSSHLSGTEASVTPVEMPLSIPWYRLHHSK